MKETLVRKIMREIHDYYKLSNAERTPEKLNNVKKSMEITDKLLQQIPDDVVTNIKIDKPQTKKK